MKKKVLSVLIGSMVVASVGFAAPVVDLEKNQTAVGYNYSKLDIDLEGVGSTEEKFHSVYVQHKFDEKVSFGLEQTRTTFDGDELKLVDMLGQYALDDHTNLVLGVRKYKITLDGVGSASESKATLGINGHTQLADSLTGYAQFLTNSYEKEWKFGATYQMAQNTYLDVNYTRHKADTDFGDLTFKGFGFGVGFMF